MIGRNISLIQKLSHSVQMSIKKDDKLTTLNELATLISVGIWMDKRVRVEEVLEGEAIIAKILDHSDDIAFTEDLVTRRLEKFTNDPKFFNQKKSELIVNITKNANYDFAECMIEIFKADGEIALEEKETIDQLSKYLDIKDSLLSMAEKINHAVP